MFDVFHLSYFIKNIKSNTNNVLSLSLSLLHSPSTILIFHFLMLHLYFHRSHFSIVKNFENISIPTTVKPTPKM